MATRRQRRTQKEVRTLISGTARPLFAEHGYHGVSAAVSPVGREVFDELYDTLCDNRVILNALLAAQAHDDALAGLVRRRVMGSPSKLCEWLWVTWCNGTAPRPDRPGQNMRD